MPEFPKKEFNSPNQGQNTPQPIEKTKKSSLSKSEIQEFLEQENKSPDDFE